MNRITLKTVAILMLSLAPLAAQQRQRQAIGRNNFGPGGFNSSSMAYTNYPVSDFRAFNLLVTRNIFNANRVAGRPDYVPGPKAAPFDTFSLLGTMAYHKGLFAVFGGSQPEFRKILGPGDTIAGYRIAEITYENISLVKSNDPPITVPIGSQMRRDEQGPWRFLGRSTAEPATVATASADSSSSSSADSETDPVLKRLMEKRRQEQEGTK
jgi:hypothetical protein